MANPDIQLMGATYPAVSGVTLPVAGGGTATFPFVEGSQNITQNGTVDVTNLAQVIVNVAGGGGSGLVYETGTYSPAENIAQPTISFANTHTDTPLFVMIVDSNNDYFGTNNANMFVYYIDWFKLTGGCIYASSTTKYYGVVVGSYRFAATSTNTTTKNLTYPSTDTGSSSANYPKYWVTQTGFRPYTNSDTRYWCSGRTYKWIAVWAPTT